MNLDWFLQMCGDQNELTSQNGKCIVEDFRKYKCIKPYEE